MVTLAQVLVWAKPVVTFSSGNCERFVKLLTQILYHFEKNDKLELGKLPSLEFCPIKAG
jgi:hypothetical protein